MLFVLIAYGQQTSVAVLPSEGSTRSNDELEAITDEMREAALKVLPTDAFVLLKQDVVIKRLGGAENYIKECSKSSCIVNLGQKAQVDYVAQASIGKLDSIIRIKVELYNVHTEGLVGMFNDEAETVRDLIAIVKKKVPDVFSKIPGAYEADAEKSSFGILEMKQAYSDGVGSYDDSYAKPSVGRSIKNSFWLALGLDIFGTILIYNGYVKNKETQDAYDKYKKEIGPNGNYKDTWEYVESNRISRNIFYAVGGIFLASGIGVHIWF